MRTGLLILTAGAAAAAGAAALGYLRTLNARTQKKELKEEITKWEDEGGNVPQVPTPAPVAAPERSVPEEVAGSGRSTKSS